MTDRLEDRIAEVTDALASAELLWEDLLEEVEFDPSDAQETLALLMEDLECAVTVENEDDLDANLLAVRQKVEAIERQLSAISGASAKAVLRCFRTFKTTIKAI